MSRAGSVAGERIGVPIEYAIALGEQRVLTFVVRRLVVIHQGAGTIGHPNLRPRHVALGRCAERLLPIVIEQHNDVIARDRTPQGRK